VGDLLDISEPKNFFELDKTARKSLLFAGGIGITPMASMAQQLAENGADFQLHYCARSKSRAAFVWRIEESSFLDRAFFHFDDAPEDQHLDIDGVLRDAPEGTHIYVCGPKGFMDHVVNAARKLDWPAERIHREVFEQDHSTNDGNESFQVKIASTGEIYSIPPDVRVTKALQEHGVFIPTSCTQGVCGTCLTDVLEGTPDHRDHYLTPEEQAENKMFLPCCSRSRSPMLVLDL
jgi:vanillate O-demethylase ferredoxin subunit|tara:strand:- start:930 stop:1631 length:702 start_codon:yes stop_codon:yes gene_type:complete